MDEQNAGPYVGGPPPGVWLDPVVPGAGFGPPVGGRIGVFGAAVPARRPGVAKRPRGVISPRLYELSIPCGIGVTMGLFIGDPASRGTPRGDEVEPAVFTASPGVAVPAPTPHRGVRAADPAPGRAGARAGAG